MKWKNKRNHNVGTDPKSYRKRIEETKSKSVPITHKYMTGHFHGLVRGTGKIIRGTGKMMRGTGEMMRGTGEMMRGTGEMMPSHIFSHM